MQTPVEALHPDKIQGLIQRFRAGEQINLLCHRTFDAFSPAEIYSVQKISGGNALEVIDDDGDSILMDDRYPGLGCFLLPANAEQAAELSGEMKLGFVSDLAQRIADLMHEQSFAPGDLVCWKEGCQVSTMPSPGQPAVVLELLTEARVSEDAHLLDPLATLSCDMMIGFDGPDGLVVTTYADSRRFKHYSIQIEALRKRLSENTANQPTPVEG